MGLPLFLSAKSWLLQACQQLTSLHRLPEQNVLTLLQLTCDNDDEQPAYLKIYIMEPEACHFSSDLAAVIPTNELKFEFTFL